MIIFNTVRYKNFLSTGNAFTEISLDKHPTTLIVGKNGNGKCLHPSTEININFINSDVEKKFKKFMKNRK
jgi:predicted ATP-binding protein involved in virulence